MTTKSTRTRSAARTGALVVLLLGVMGSSVPAAALTHRSPDRTPLSVPRHPGKVLIIATPRLRWEDLVAFRPPHLLALAGRSAVASMAVRAVSSGTSAADGYATIGAGNRTNLGNRFPVDDALSVTESIGGQDARSVFRLATGRTPTHQVLVPQIAAIADTLRTNPYGAQVGALADSLASSGHGTAVVADADLILSDGTLERHRAAGLAVTGHGGETSGTVGGLSVTDPGVAGGQRMDDGRVLSAVERAWARNDVVLVELSDLERTDTQRSQQTASAGFVSWRAAVSRSDELVGQLLAHVVRPRDLVIAASPTSPRPNHQLGVAMVSGPGFHRGWATASPRRPGYLTLVDIAPTILSFLGASIPSSMSGRAIRVVHASPEVTAQLHLLVGHDVGALFMARTVGPISTLIVLVAILIVVLTAAEQWSSSRRLNSVQRVVALSALWLPTVTFASGILPIADLSPAVYVVSVCAVAVGIGCVLQPLQRRTPTVSIILATGSFALLSVVDVATGARLQINTALGYSPIVAGRFAGFGNLAFGLTAMALLLTATTLFSRLHRNSPAARPAVAAPALLGAGLILAVGGFAIASPWWGSKFGGTIAAIPAFAVTLILLSGRRINWRIVAGLALVTTVGIATVGLVDLMRPADQQTHVGQFLRTLANGQAARVIQRKLDANLRILTSSIWVTLVPIGIAFVLLSNRRTTGKLRRVAATTSGVNACLVGACVCGLIAALLTDSGAAVPAAMFTLLIPYLALLMTGPSDVPEPPEPIPEDAIRRSQSPGDRWSPFVG